MNSKTSTRDIIRSMNYNVKLIFSFYLFNSLGRGIWMGTALSMYIYIFAGEAGGLFGLSQSVVLGLTSAASGITMTIFVFPAGYFADRFRRDILLKIAGVIGVIGLAFVAFGNSFLYIFIALFLLGLFNALVRPSLEALFADSVASGYRSKIYSWAHLVRQFAMAAGPILAAIVFAIIGNEWDLGILKKVMYVGFVVSLIGIVILFIFKDERSLGKESEEIAKEVTEEVKEQKSRLALKVDSGKAAKLIPILLVSSNLLVGIGAGMSIKYFPVFFTEKYFISPVWLNIIMGATSLATGLLGLVSQKVSLRLGRVQTIFIVQFIATFCLLIIAIYPPFAVLVPFFILRGSFMNAGQPLSRSILMDVIPKRRRGIWNSIEAIAWGLFWNASAVIGGFIVGANNNFNLCFIITTFIYIVGMIPVILMMPLVGKEREAKDQDVDIDSTKIIDSESASSDSLIDFDYTSTSTAIEETSEGISE
ncbi:MAG: MFS transporter [Candidatus Heimdallarchaeota archaeon]|nr:MFS transporter [Candidatus Heimdallarchaeota archaeon]MCG3253467.1 MFS transporter [Candidatus Heimdallarchaeota archaeon]MCK4290604.1 MFS transporter [Candidatus Heimdallarchaeota archaeon]